MQHYRRLILAAGIFSIGALFQGCATLNGTVPFKYVPSLPTGEPISLRVGMEKLTDVRSKDDRQATESIADVDEKITAKLLEDFRSSQIFTTIDFPVQKEKDAIVIKGEIKQFYWKLTPSPVIFIPFIQLLMYFGVPIYDVVGIADFHVQLVNPLTGQVVREYDKSSTKTESYTLYNLKAGEAGAELAEAFREVSKQIKQGIVADGQEGRLLMSH
jgi:hypothetical protein